MQCRLNSFPHAQKTFSVLKSLIKVCKFFVISIRDRKGKRKEKMESNLGLAHVHALSNLGADWRDLRIRPLERRRMQLSTSPALKSTALRTLNFKLPPDPSHRLHFSWRKREELPTHPAKGAMVIVHNSLVTIFITDVRDSCRLAPIHVPEYMFVLASLVTFVTWDWPFPVEYSGQKNDIAWLGNHRVSIYLHYPC